MHRVLVNRLVKLAQEKSVVRRTDCPNMTISVDWDVKNQTKQQKMRIWYLSQSAKPNAQMTLNFYAADRSLCLDITRDMN